jgi:hypothetical protein
MFAEMMFVVVDAGRGLSGNWANRLNGPSGVELVSAAADTAADASVRSSFTAFGALINEWTVRVRHRRCGLARLWSTWSRAIGRSNRGRNRMGTGRRSWADRPVDENVYHLQQSKTFFCDRLSRPPKCHDLPETKAPTSGLGDLGELGAVLFGDERNERATCKTFRAVVAARHVGDIV